MNGGNNSFIQDEINILEALGKAKSNILSEKRFNHSTLMAQYAKEKLREDKNSLMNDTYQNIKDFSNRGLSWNIAYMDNIIRSESYIRNAITWRATKALENGIDLNIRDDKVNVDRVIGILDDLKTKYKKPLLSFGYLGIGYGGSGALIVIDGETKKEDMLKPLRAEDLRQGQTMSLRPLTRLYQIQPDFSRADRYITKVGKETGIFDDTELGKPQYYRVSISGDMFKQEKNGQKASFGNMVNTFIVHRSRLLVFNGNVLTWIEEQKDMYFGQSIVEGSIEEIKKYKKSLEEIMKLLNRSNLPVINMKGLQENNRAGDISLSKIDDLILSYQYALENGDLFVVGAKDEEELKFLQAEFRELSNILLDRKKELTASLNAPLSATFNVKDDLDESVYFFSVSEMQERQLAPAYRQIIPIIYKIKYGEDIPDYSFVFKSLEKTTEKDKIDKLEVATKIIKDLFEANLITYAVSQKMLISASNNVNDMFYEISKLVESENKDKLFKDFQIEIANELNWQSKKDDLKSDENSKYNMAETKLKGRNEGGDPDKTKKPSIKL